MSDSEESREIHARTYVENLSTNSVEIPAGGGGRRRRSSVGYHLYQRDKSFVGRTFDFAEIHASLTSGRPLGVYSIVAVQGLPGIGKTSTANEYGWRFQDFYSGGCLLLPCGFVAQEESTRHACLRITMFVGALLGVQVHGVDEASVVREVRSILDGVEHPVLLILDNILHADHLLQILGLGWIPERGCHILVSTRRESLGAAVKMQTLDGLPHELGVELLAQYRADAKDPANRAAVSQIVLELDGHSFGLTLVGAYMDLNPRATWDDFCTTLHTRAMHALTATEEDVLRRLDSLGPYGKRLIDVCHETVASLGKWQRRCLLYAVRFPAGPFPRRTLARLMELDGICIDLELPGYQHSYDAPIDDLVRLRLLRRSGEDTNTLTLHRIIRSFLIEQAKADVAETHILEVVRKFNREEELQKFLQPAGGNICSQCGQSVESSDQFCMHCGVQLVETVRTCPQCGAYPMAGDHYCIFCGHALAPRSKGAHEE